MKRRFYIVAMAAVIGIMVGPPDTMADEHYVVTNGTPGVSPTPDYTTWGTAATNIQDAVNVAADNDLVWVTNGTYYCWNSSAAAGYTSMVTVTKNITIKSVNGPQATIVDANYPAFINRCFYITSNATVSGFTITNGHVRDVASGGGVFISGSGLVTNCWITGNVVTDGTVSAYCGGGGVYCSNGGEVVNCQIYGNIATNFYQYDGGTNGGGGVAGYKGGVIRDCVISNNISFRAGYAVRFTDVNLISNCTVINNRGGGIRVYMSSGGGTVDTCRIIGNITANADDFHAGGLWLYSKYGYIIARNCRINNNTTAHRGGGVLMIGGVLDNCVISNNVGYTGGGVVMYGLYGNSLVQNCSIISNRGTGSKGGVYIWTGGRLRNSLVANNQGDYGAGVGLYTDTAYAALRWGWVENCTIVSNIGYGLYGDTGGGKMGTNFVFNTIIYSNSVDWGTNICAIFFTNCCAASTNDMLGSGNITDWPEFVEYSAGNYRLRLRSPCINAGTNQDWMTNAVDLDRNARILNNIVDIGAYETFFWQGAVYKFH